ncbi:MAG: UDP-galactopyranose mutase [Candidatus Methylacidiphilales bacterium]
MLNRYDYLIVGAGYAGAVLAERLASQRGKRCLVVDRRDHIAGNSFDEINEAGVLTHRYGPHYFRSNSSRIIDYLSAFTAWHPVDYTILSWVDGCYWPFPINLNTFEQLVGHPSTPEEMQATLDQWKVAISEPQNSEEVIVSQVGWKLYEMFFKNYTRKQWKRDPRELDASVCGRIPIRTNRDNRYLRENFQALPRDGYTAMFRRILDHPFIELKLRTDYRELLPHIEYGHLIYTGAIDDYFDYVEGPLPYRSLRFEPEHFDAEALTRRQSISGKPGFWQPAMQVNYPNDEDFTRIVEIKHATGQECENTTIVREYPEDYAPGGEAYYPIPASDSKRIYDRYYERAQAEKGVSFVGRLATYRYYNMDQVVGMALAEFDRLGAR